MYHIKTPSRICLFGEHQDYLGLEVIASAINLYFNASVELRNDSKIVVLIRDRSISELGAVNKDKLYEKIVIDLNEYITYEGKRDYFKSGVSVLRRAGIEPVGVDITLDSEIPIGKGMCSSTALVLAYLTSLVAPVCSEEADIDPLFMAKLAWKAEVAEFNEPGGMMDHYASALGGMCHMDFSGDTIVKKLDAGLDGAFILIDSLQQKDTIKVLSESKYPTLEGLDILRSYGVQSIRDFYNDKTAKKYLNKLDIRHRQKVAANIDNYEILQTALSMFESGNIDDEKLGELLNEHQKVLRYGLNVSTKIIDDLLRLSMKHGAFGGKINGSGGGGCLFVYVPKSRAEEIVYYVNKAGYPAAILKQSDGLRVRVMDRQKV